MDEEDLAEAEEARKLQTAESFGGLGSTAEEKLQHDSFMDVFKTTGETIGVKLLKKMGWREGQGIGPKIKRNARLGDDQEREGEGDQQIHLFAPENSSMISIMKKNDRKGLGFEGQGKLSEAPIAESSPRNGDHGREDDENSADFRTLGNSVKINKKNAGRKGGFGVGILNDNGSDDEDPYQIGPQISYNRVIGGDKKNKKKLESGRSTANPLVNSKPVFISKKAGTAKGNSTFRRCHDGRLPLDGFVLSSNSDPLSSILSQDGKYPPPNIPPDWKSSKRPSRSTSSPSSQPYQSAATVAAASKLSPKSRAALLGETQLPGKSVFDFLTPDARSRIASATNNENLPPALGEASKSSSTSQPKTLQSLVPNLDQDTAMRALGRGTTGWMPYAEDPPKRTRYRSFLEIRAGLRPEGTLPDRPPGATNDDWVVEMNEFARAAQIFKPMTGTMATRFTSSSSAPKLATNNVKLDSTTGSVGEPQLLTKPTGKIKTPTEEAAAVGMYGPLTRSVENFYPTRLLCKRFNVQPPAHVQVDPGSAPPGSNPKGNPGSSTALSQKGLELVGKKDMDELRMTGGGMREFVQSSEANEGNAGEEAGPSKVGAVVVDPERNEALEQERPGEAVFKAIFGSDSEDD